MAMNEAEKAAALEASEQRLDAVQQQQAKAVNRASRLLCIEKAVAASANLNCHADDLVKLAKDLHAFLTEGDA